MEERCASSPAKGKQLLKFSEVQRLLKNMKQSSSDSRTALEIYMTHEWYHL